MKSFLLSCIRALAKRIIAKHRPFIIGVTGTVGKTTVTHFTYDYLRTLYGDAAYMSPHNYNGEFGLPFTIFGVRTPNANPFLWCWVFIKGFARLFDKKYPKYLVLEYGIDHPGEMAFLLSIAKPDIGILLNISKNHIVNFRSFESYAKEKILFGETASSVIYNMDDTNIMNRLSDEAKARGVSFAMKKKSADVYVKGVDAQIDGISFDVCSGDICATASYPVVGSYQAYNLLPVFALGKKLGKEIHDIVGNLKDVHPQKGRGSVLHGVKESIILDGSYNGGFMAMGAGIEYLAEAARDQYARILVLGDMRELGDETENLHDEIANQIIATNPDAVVLVGPEMRRYVFPKVAEALGAERAFSFFSSRVAGVKVRECITAIEKPCLVFVKGSQNNIYLEEGIKEFLFDLRDAEKLCRQAPRWLKMKNHFFEAVVSVD